MRKYIIINQSAKIFHLSAKLNVSDIDKAFESMHQSAMMKMNSDSKDWIVKRNCGTWY